MKNAVKLLFSVLLILPLFACAEKSDTAADAKDFNPSAYTAGKEYEEIVPPGTTRNADKIEVIEFFWYGCSHCYALEPHLEKWRETISDDVDFYQIPVTFQSRHKFHARIFYTAELLGLIDKVHPFVYEAIHEKDNPLADEAAAKAFLMQHGVSEQQFNENFNSFGVESSIKKASSKSLSYGILGTPTIIINGKYRTSAGLAGSEEELFKVMDFLIEKERRAKNSK